MFQRSFDVGPGGELMVSVPDADIQVVTTESAVRALTSDGDIELGTVHGALADLETSDGNVRANALDTDRTGADL